RRGWSGPRVARARRRSTASGLIRMRLRSTATAAATLSVTRPMSPRGAAPLRPPRAERRRRPGQRGLDRGLAVRAHLPDRLERRAAADTRLLELRRAHRADEGARGDLGVADRAAQGSGPGPSLPPPDLE